VRAWQNTWPWIIVVLGLILAGIAAWIALGGTQIPDDVYNP
jgi:hypothetical protein